MNAEEAILAFIDGVVKGAILLCALKYLTS